MLGEERALAFEKVQQIGHLFEIGRHIGIVATQMHIIELKIKDVLDTIAEVAPVLLRRRACRLPKRDRSASRDRETYDPPHPPGPPDAASMKRRDAARGGEPTDGLLPIVVRKVAEP
jgi:hypothetical protein